MLIQFTVENFLSFDEATTFSMRAGKDKDHASHLTQVGKETIVQGAAIYGANAAGKSNLVLAMGFARDLIVGNGRANLDDLQPFRLNENEERSSGFHWQFFHAGRLWSYGFDLTKTTVTEEYLFAREIESGREKLWFERTTDEIGRTKVKLGAEFVATITKDDAQLLKLKAPRLDSDTLFSREVLAEKIDAIAPVFEWFEDVLLIVRAETAYEPLLKEVHEDEALLNFMSEHLNGAGTGISELVSSEFDLDFMEQNGLDASRHRNTIESLLKNAGEHQVISVPNKTQMDVNMALRKEGGKIFCRFLNSMHGEQMFRLDEESEGTLRFIHLLPHFYRLQTGPTVLIIDEFERRLHTLLTQRLLKNAFDSPQQSNQFIFTTHDTNLLDSDLLRRDEIWFVDKNERGASSLVSLAEFKIRSDADYEKGYLLGAFDGIPYFGNTPSAPSKSADQKPELAEAQ